MSGSARSMSDRSPLPWQLRGHIWPGRSLAVLCRNIASPSQDLSGSQPGQGTLCTRHARPSHFEPPGLWDKGGHLKVLGSTLPASHFVLWAAGGRDTRAGKEAHPVAQHCTLIALSLPMSVPSMFRMGRLPRAPRSQDSTDLDSHLPLCMGAQALRQLGWGQ